MATTRLLRSARPIQLPSSSSCSSVKCVGYQRCMASVNGDNRIAYGKGERKAMVAADAVKASSMAASTDLVTASPQPAVGIRQGLSNLADFVLSISNAVVLLMKRRPWIINLHPQMLIEKAIMDCRFFTLLAVAGSLLGSVLCFVEGCVLVMESYAHYFRTLSQRLDQEHHLVHLLIEAIDMFLVGTALLVFGVGLYVMFVGSRSSTNSRKEKEPYMMSSGSNLLGLFHMKSTPRWVGMQSISEAKSKIGHAVMMILQVGLLDKFKDIPLVTGFDLACFAAAVLTSSASIFVLSRLHN